MRNSCRLIVEVGEIAAAPLYLAAQAIQRGAGEYACALVAKLRGINRAEPCAAHVPLHQVEHHPACPGGCEDSYHLRIDIVARRLEPIAQRTGRCPRDQDVDASRPAERGRQPAQRLAQSRAGIVGDQGLED